MIRVTIFNEYFHEKESGRAHEIYPECGLTDEVISDTDVMIWWGHLRHNLVPDNVAERVKNAVNAGMGIIFLHSAHHSKTFKLLMVTAWS